ncbi:MAG TPA: NAD(P)H-hydrate dehydratase, partial [Chitinophagaceae bacterium]|nr:NAD(P)H-hydrate dehydratase [Chitinophagaceae bacterium]
TIIANYHKPILLDADALNILSLNKHLLPAVADGSVLTPHPKEFARLFGETENEFERWQSALNVSAQYDLVIVVKGHYTLIAHKGKGWFNTTGNAGMAKGGSGDVLSGMITAFLGQQYNPLHAAMLGVYLHGLAADIALENQSQESLLATDIIQYIGHAFNALD